MCIVASGRSYGGEGKIRRRLPFYFRVCRVGFVFCSIAPEGTEALLLLWVVPVTSEAGLFILICMRERGTICGEGLLRPLSGRAGGGVVR